LPWLAYGEAQQGEQEKKRKRKKKAKKNTLN
jgi:hypothetical protein